MSITFFTSSLDWASDQNYDNAVGPSGSAWHGTPTKVEPSTTRKQQGYVPSQSLDPQSLNWLLNSLIQKSTDQNQ